MSKYEERVKQREDEMEAALMGLPGGDRISLSDALTAFAQLSVAREAEQWEDGFAFGYDSGQVHAEPDIEKVLIERGLIPPPNEKT